MFGNKIIGILAGMTLGLALLLSPALFAEEAGIWRSASGNFQVSFSSSLTPIPINQIHAWTLHLTDADGRGVSGARIEIDGGMPAHNHGLPTVPRVSEELGDGYYLVEGFRFHMMGEWLVNLVINHEGRRETLSIPLNL